MVEKTKRLPPQAGPENGEREDSVDIPEDIPEEGVRVSLTPEKIAELRRRGYQVDMVGQESSSDDDWKRYDAPTPTVYTPPVGDRFYGAELDDVVESAKPLPPEDSKLPGEVGAGGGGLADSIGPSSPEDRPLSDTPIGEPNQAEADRAKSEDNTFFKKLEEIVTDENIEQWGKMLKSYAGVDLPTDKLKKVLPKFLPVLTKYGNRVFGGENPQGFAKYSAEAEKYAEFGNDVRPLLGAIIEAVMEPQKDQTGQVVLRPEDEQKFDKLEGEVNDESLSDFLKDDSGEDQKNSGLPSDMVTKLDKEPRRMFQDGRGGASHESYAAPGAEPKIARGMQLESIEELSAKARERAPDAFDAGMAEARRREADMRAQPELSSYENEMKALRRRDEDLQSRPALAPAKDANADARERDLRSQPMLQSKKPVDKKEVQDSDIDVNDFFMDEDGTPPG